MLQIKGVSKQYRTGELVQQALNDVSLNLRDNEFVSILGPSGSGKTTLLNVIGGLDRYDTGDLVINGISTKEYKDHDWDAYQNHTIGFVFQSYNLIPHQTILSNVELALTIGGISRNDRKERARKALEEVGLGDLNAEDLLEESVEAFGIEADDFTEETKTAFENLLNVMIENVIRQYETPGSEMGEVLSAGGSMLLCALGSLVTAFIVGFFVAQIAAGLAMRLREAVYNKTMDFSMEEIGKFSRASRYVQGKCAVKCTYGENGRQSVDEELLWKSIEIAQAGDFVQGMENGYHTAVAQGGTNLSGGQKQRLAIARAIYRRPEIYIFDDSFSALDYKTDRILRKTLKQVIKNAAGCGLAEYMEKNFGKRLAQIMMTIQLFCLDTIIRYLTMGISICTI